MENIKIQSTVYPDQQLTEDQWKQYTKASSAYVDRKPIHNANEMMKDYDQDRLNKYYKKLLLSIF